MGPGPIRRDRFDRPRRPPVPAGVCGHRAKAVLLAGGGPQPGGGGGGAGPARLPAPAACGGTRGGARMRWVLLILVFLFGPPARAGAAPLPTLAAAPLAVGI